MKKDPEPWNKVLFCFCILLNVIVLSSCANGTENSPENSFYDRAEEQLDTYVQDSQSSYDQIYQDTLDRILNGQADELEGEDIFDKLNKVVLRGYYRVYHTIRSLGPVIIIGSMGTGILMLVFATQNKQIMRLGLFGFIIGIPSVVILIVFGVGIFNEMFLY